MTTPLSSGEPPVDHLDSSLRSALLSRLSSLPFTAFARCVGLLLARMGYTNVRPAGRGHYRGGGNRHHKGGSGGYDLVADLPAPKGTAIRRFATVSLKQFPPDAPARVFQRQVDEARGASLRAGASASLLITTGPVSPTVAHRESLPLAPIAPVSVVDGDELAKLCIRFGVGIVPAQDGRGDEQGTESEAVLDAAFFDRLAREATGSNGPDDFTEIRKGSKNLSGTGTPPPFSLSVHVSVTRVGKRGRK